MGLEFEYQKNRRFFGQISRGMEELGIEEIAPLGAESIRAAYRGLYFEADNAALYRINYLSRLLTRILAPFISFRCDSTDRLYHRARSVQWSTIIRPEQTFAIFAKVSNSQITHSHFAAQRLKDAIVDQIREEKKTRPGIDTKNPDHWLNLYIENNRATISLDTSRGSLHRRGYRLQAGLAPMQETLAAAIIYLSEWDGSRPLYDPFCGSGTLLCEALMHYCRIPAAYLRKKFGFQALPDYDEDVWNKIKTQSDAAIRTVPPELITGSDVSGEAVRTARRNLRRLPYGEQVSVRLKNFKSIPAIRDSVIVTNPPFGVRMGDESAAAVLYKELGDFLKQRCTGSRAYIYFGNREHLKKIGLRSTWKKPLVNGALDGRLAEFELY